MTTPLFREEALKNSHTSQGQTVGRLPVTWIHIGYLLLSLFCTTTIFLFTGSFPRKETVQGTLQATGGEIRILPIQSGIVSELHVELGDKVRRGDPLIAIDTDRQLDTVNTLTTSRLASIQAENENIRQKRESVIQASKLSEASLRIAIERVRHERAAAQRSIGLLGDRITLAEERLAAYTHLWKEGAASQEERRSREDALLSLRQQANDLLGRVQDATERGRDLALQLERAKATTSGDIATLNRETARLNGEEASARADGRAVILATVDGTISSSQVTVGDKVDTSHPMMSISPSGAELVAEMFVPSRAIAFIEPNQEVKIRIDAIPFQKFGIVKGKVSKVASFALSPQEIRTAVASKEPVYRLLVSLPAQTITSNGKSTPLRAGMSLSADIILERRTIAEWLLAPLIRGSV